ncbi:MAG: PfkB family carbohydrate kinase [Oscillospiraceae bacterium]|nr:PfkB family carbohydrate kinase [Oscillospiraceae bacterium]MDY4191622.1 PfkB family carbohydrate kinase [Oscillospiraceae bacterium]
MRLLGIGHGVMDIYPVQGRMYPGGNEFNVVYNARQLGAQAAFMGVFADDRAAGILEDTLRGAGVDVSRSHHERGSSGYALVELRDGDRVFTDWNRSCALDEHPFCFTEEELRYAAGFDVVSTSYASRLSPEQISRLHGAGARVSHDFNDDFTQRQLEEIAPYTEFAMLSCGHLPEEELERLGRTVTDLGARRAVMTLGSRGAALYEEGRLLRVPARKAEAVDTMGAGDSFIAAFLVSWMDQENTRGGADPEQALRDAAAHAAHVVTLRGSTGISFEIDPAKIGEYLHVNRP